MYCADGAFTAKSAAIAPPANVARTATRAELATLDRNLLRISLPLCQHRGGPRRDSSPTMELNVFHPTLQSERLSFQLLALFFPLICCIGDTFNFVRGRLAAPQR